MNNKPDPELLPAANQPHFQPPSHALVPHEPAGAVALPSPTPNQMMQAMIERGVTQENAAAFKELVLLSEHMEDRQAKKDFARAFVALQRDIPRIKATKIIPDKYGNQRSSFAPFEEIDSQARPICLQHGFTYSFSEGPAQPGKITKICTLLHEETGIEKSNPYSVRIGSGPPGCSEAQADGSAHSYAKRGALCDALNIVVVGIDNDARLEGGNITEKQADELEKRVALLNQDHKKFLKWLGANSYAEIAANKYEMADQFLRQKEAGR